MADVASSPQVVVFDFDGTLVSRDSFLDFSVRYCIRRPWRLLLVAAVLPLALVVLRRSKTSAPSVLLWAMTVGASTRKFVLELRRYARRVLVHYANESIFQELTQRVSDGSRVVVATGSLPILVRSLFSARQAAALSVVGSRFRSRWCGLVVETHCTGRTKPRELKRRFGIEQWASVYTDSFADGPLLRGANDIVLVGPSPSTLERTRQLLGPTVSLRVLRSSRGER